MPKQRIKPDQNPRRAKSIDAHVGKRLKARRLTAGLSQTALAAVAGISFQQLQKYEKGTNRISASHLFAFAQALGCTPNDFFDGLAGKTGELTKVVEELRLTSETIKLLQAFSVLDTQARAAVLKFSKSLSSGDKG